MKTCDYLFAIGMPTVLDAGCPIFLAVALFVALLACDGISPYNMQSVMYMYIFKPIYLKTEEGNSPLQWSFSFRYAGSSGSSQ